MSRNPFSGENIGGNLELKLSSFVKSIVSLINVSILLYHKENATFRKRSLNQAPLANLACMLIINTIPAARFRL